MSDATEMAERHGRVLAELSELALSLARHLHERALSAEAPEEAARLGGAFHAVSRSARQSLALEARLERDRRRRDQEDRAEAAREARVRVHTRRAQLRAAVERLIWTESEGEEAERLLDDLDDFLDETALYDDFTETPVEAHIQRIGAELGLFPPRHPGRSEAGSRSPGPAHGPPRSGLGAGLDDDQGWNDRRSSA